MKTPHGHINLIADATYIHQKTLQDINEHVREGKLFALGYQEGKEKRAMIFDVKTLKSFHTDGGEFIYNCFENFADAVRMTLIAYPVFISCEKMIEEKKPKIIMLP